MSRFLIYLSILSLFAFTKADASSTITEDLLRAKDKMNSNPKESISLARLLLSESTDTTHLSIKDRVIVLNILSEAYYLLDQYDSSLYFAQRSKYVLENSIIDNLTPQAYELLAINHYILAQYDSAIIYYKKYAFRINDNYSKANTLRNLALTYNKISNTELAISHLQNAIIIFNSINEKRLLANSYQAIASIYRDQNNFNESLKFNHLALSTLKQTQDKKSTGRTLNNIGNLLHEMQEFDSARTYLVKSIQAITNANDSSSLTNSYQNLGSLEMDLGNYEQAASHLKTAIQLAEKYNQPLELLSGYHELTSLYLKTQSLTEAKALLDKALPLSLNILSPEKRAETYQLLSEYYELSGDLGRSLDYYKRYQHIRDTLVNEERVRAISNLQVKFETEQKEREINQLSQQQEVQKALINQQNQFLYLLGFFSLILLGISIVAYNSYRLKRKAHSKIELLLRELHHRTKNNLSVLSAMLSLQSEKTSDQSTKEAIKQGEMRINAISMLHQRLYMTGTSTDIDIKDYLEELLQDIKISYQDDFQPVKLKQNIQSVNMNVDSVIPVGLIVNELVSNAYKYAFKDSTGSSVNEIEVSLTATSTKRSNQINQIVLTIQDNGIGFNHDDESISNSFGLRMVDILTRQLKAQKEFNKGNKGLGKLDEENKLGTHYRFII